MRKEEFVPGKIYHTDTNKKLKYYYIGQNNLIKSQGIFQEITSGITYSLTYSWLYESNTYEWKEYKEPRRGTRWMNVYSSPIGNIYTATHETKEQADRILQNEQRIACVEVPWVEGQGL